MAGLLDLADNPNMALAMGLLNASGHQSRPVSLGQALGQGLQGMREAKQNQLNSMLRNIQMGELLRKQQEAERQRQQQEAFRGTLPEQDRGLFDVAPGEFIKNMPRFQPMKEVEVADPAEPLRTIKQWMRPGETTGIPIGFGKMPEFLDPRYQAVKQAIAKAGAANTSVSYGAPMAGVDKDGNPVFFQPDKKGGTPAIVPGVTPPPKADQASEDERKAAGWLNQATNAWKNMQSAAFDRMGNIQPDARPGFAEMLPLPETVLNATRSEGRQKFVQAASSLSEALLRAATGAGVNKDEAAQKVAELTPRPFDSRAVIEQKMNSIPMYLESLKQRAGRAAPKQAVQGAPASSGGWSAVIVE